MILTHQRIEDLVKRSHDASRAAGWWTDLKSGEPLVRNHGEMLMLMVSELVEAWEGEESGAMDEHLPQYKSLVVELADFLIRAGDFAGGHGWPLAEAVRGCPTTLVQSDHALIPIVYVGRCMEHDRKKRYSEACNELAQAVWSVVFLAEQYEYDLWPIIEAKLEYNSRRADHKPAARMAEGGKQY